MVLVNPRQPRKVGKHPGCGFAPRTSCEGLEAASKSTTSERAIPSWDRLGEEGEPSWRWEILRGIPHLSNVTYFPLGERNMVIHLRLRVLSVISNRTLYLC